MKRSYLKRKTGFKHPSDINDIKDQIQELLRAIAIKRDVKCILSDYPETGKCGGYRNDGELILQYDHLNSRTHSISFADLRLGVLICKRHHIFYKKQYPAEYEKCVRDAIGEERCKLLDRVREDRRAYKMDWKLELLGLKKELEKYTI